MDRAHMRAEANPPAMQGYRNSDPGVSIDVDPSSDDVRGSMGSESKARPSSSRRLLKPLERSQVDWLLSMQSDEDRAVHARPWFAEDCKRRFRGLDAESSEKLGATQLQGLLKMFPTLSLDLMAEGQTIHAVDENSVANLLEVFDSNSDGFLSEEDFTELMKFCHAWRSHFYIKAVDSVKPASTTVEPSNNLTLLGAGVGKKKATKNSAAAKRASEPQPKMRGRRASGFGPRLLGMPMGEIETESKAKPQASETVAADALNSSKDLPAELEEPAISMKRTKSEMKLAFRDSHSQRRNSAPSVLNVDASRGSFYSSFASVCHLRYASASRESSPSLDSAFSDD